MTTEVQIGPWYPAPAPGSGAHWFDHLRSDPCSFSSHLGCLDSGEKPCKCPCHSDEPMAEAKSELERLDLMAISDLLREFYSLPEATTVNVAWLGYTVWRDAQGGDGLVAAVRQKLTERYPVQGVRDGFLADVVAVVHHVASRSAAAAGGAR